MNFSHLKHKVALRFYAGCYSLFGSDRSRAHVFLDKIRYHLNRSYTKSFHPDDVEYVLASVPDLALLYPGDITAIPEEELKLLEPGAVVKLMFHYMPLPIKDAHEAPPEFLCVQIVSSSFPDFTGVLVDEPVFGWELEAGDPVLFAARHVLDIEEKEFYS